MTFFVTGLPRSRTTWFAAYLDCDHDLSVKYTPDEIDQHWNDGLSDSFLMFYPRPLPGPTVIIHRPIEEVRISLFALDIDPGQMLDIAADRLNSIEGLHVNFEDINDRLQEITEFVGLKWDSAKADRFKKMRIEPLEITRQSETVRSWLWPLFGHQ